MISQEEIEYKLKWLQELLRMFVQSLNVNEEDFTLSLSELINIVVDVNDEISKIMQFHSLLRVSVAREVSLYCYYFLKRKPIIIMDEKQECSHQINERFCVFLLLNSVTNVEIWDKEYIQFLVSMFYRGELSKDAIYLLSNTISQIDKFGGSADGNGN